MSAVAQTDAGTRAVNADHLAYQESMEEQERLIIRDNVPLPILVSAIATVLQKLEDDFATFVKSLPEIDPERLDPDCRNCAVCWDEFKLQSKNDSSVLSERDSTPLQLPCLHYLCKACIQDWLLKAGTCPVCRHQCCPRIGPEPTFEHQQWFRFREAYEAIVEIAPVFLAINSQNDTYGEFVLWLFAGETDEYDTDDLRARAQCAEDACEEFITTFGEFVRQDPEGRQWLMEMRAHLAARATREQSVSEDGERIDEEDLMEDDLEGLYDAEAMSEGYGSIHEDEESMDENEDGSTDEGADSPTDAAAMKEEEESMDEGEDFDQLGNYNDDDEEDSMGEGEEFDEQGHDEELENIEVDEQHTPASVLGCAAIVSMAGVGILMASRVC